MIIKEIKIDDYIKEIKNHKLEIISSPPNNKEFHETITITEKKKK